MADTASLVAPRDGDNYPTLGIARTKKGTAYDVPSSAVDELTGRGWSAPKKAAESKTPPTKASADKKEA